MLLISAIVTGLAVGSMYGLIALGYHVTYVVSNTVNFSQGSSMMLGAVLGYTFAIRLGWPLPLAVAMALLLCALFGLVVERFLVRPFAERGSNGWLMATVAGGIVLDNAVLFTFGKEPRGFPSFLAQKPIELFGAGMLIAPLFSVHSDMGTLFGIKAFAVAILGGITSASGVMMAGLLYGLIEALVTAFVGSTYTQIAAF